MDCHDGCGGNEEWDRGLCDVRVTHALNEKRRWMRGERGLGWTVNWVKFLVWCGSHCMTIGYGSPDSVLPVSFLMLDP